jgi:uncharacterized protein YkwD
MKTKRIWIALLLAIAIAVTCNTPVFADRNSDVNVAVDYLVREGVLLGDENGDLNLDKGLTRAELAMLMWRLNKMDNEDGYLGDTSPKSVRIILLNTHQFGFTDVPEWAQQAVMYCKMVNIVNGYSAVEFGPNDPVSTQQLCTVMLRWFYGKLSGNDWSYDTAVAKMRAIRLMPDYIADTPVITRNDMAVIIYNTLNPDLVGFTETYIEDAKPTYVPPVPSEADGWIIAPDLPDGTPGWVIGPALVEDGYTLQWINGYQFPVSNDGMNMQLYGRLPTDAEIYALEEEVVVRLVNIEREKAGVRELVIKPEMMDASRIKSQYMAETGEFAHSSSQRGTAGDVQKYLIDLAIRGLQSFPECIAATNHSTPKEVVKGMWMKSDGHRKILLSDYSSHIGVGMATEGLNAAGSISGYKWTLIVAKWTDENVNGDARESVRDQRPVATDPATAYNPLYTGTKQPMINP